MISVDVTTFIISALVFALVFVLKNNFFEPIARAIETRQERIRRASSAWDDAQRTIEAARREVASAVQGTRNEGYEELDRARADAQTKARAELDEGRSQTQGQMDAARKRLSEETEKAVQALEAESDALAAEIASRILGRDVA